MAKTSAISVRVPDAIKRAIDQAAREDSRSTASLAEKIVTLWLQENGYLPKVKSKSKLTE